MENLPAIIEALIFASEAPLGLEKIGSVLEGVEKHDIRQAVEKLISDYEERGSGITIQEVAGGYQYRTRPDLAPWVKKLKGVKPVSLSPAALETLAIIAYRQPIVKAEIESIRGVDVSAPIKGLLEKKLIRIVGRKDVPGKPIIYGTTKKFLEVFNLKELTDLPTMREWKEITERQGVFEQETMDFDDLADGARGERPVQTVGDMSEIQEASVPGEAIPDGEIPGEAVGTDDFQRTNLSEESGFAEGKPQDNPGASETSAQTADHKDS